MEHRPGTFAKKKFFRSVPAFDLLPILVFLRILLVLWVKTSVKSKKKREKCIEKGQKVAREFLVDPFLGQLGPLFSNSAPRDARSL